MLFLSSLFYLPYFVITLVVIGIIGFLFYACSKFEWIMCLLVVASFFGGIFFAIHSIEWTHFESTKREHPTEIIRSKFETQVVYYGERLFDKTLKTASIPDSNLCVEHMVGYNSYGFLTEEYKKMVECKSKKE